MALVARRRLQRKQVRPVAHKGDGERTTVVGPAVVVLRRSEPGGDRLQRRRTHDGGEQLGGADVGEAQHPDVAVGTFESGRPFDGVVAVLHLVQERVEVAVGCPTPSRVLDHDHVAACHVPGGMGVSEGGQVHPLVVGAAGQEDRHVAGRVEGPVDVGAQDRAVAHGCFGVSFHRDGDSGQLLDGHVRTPSSMISRANISRPSPHTASAK